MRGNAPKSALGFKSGLPQNGKKCFVCNKSACWPTYHPPGDCLYANKKNKLLQQFFPTSNKNVEEADKEEADVTEAIKDIITHVIQIDNASLQAGPPEEDAHDDKLSFSHLSTNSAANGLAAFSARFQNVACAHAASLVFPKLCFGTKFDVAMIDTGAGRESSSGCL